MEITSSKQNEEKHRLIILTDMENEPDDSQTMVRLLMYSNEIDIEGLIAVTSRWLQHEVYPESISCRINAYGVVRNNLMKHADGWPTEEYLISRVASGQIGYGMEVVGDGRSTTGSDLIIRAVDQDDKRPVYFAINAGANTLAQAIWDVRRTRTPLELEKFIRKIRVYDDAGQDDAGAWICHEFPDLFYIRSQTQVFALYGPHMDEGPQPWAGEVLWKDDKQPTCASMQPMTQWKWAEINIRRRHGVLGALYPQRVHGEGTWYGFMDGGGSTFIMGLVNKGLYDPAQISWGGWGGRFSWEKRCVQASQNGVALIEEKYKPFTMYPEAADTWRDGETLYKNSIYAPVYRWRADYTNDFRARMDWCVDPPEKANHPPRAVFNGDDNRTVVRLKADAGEVLDLDASESCDPDGDNLSFLWFPYPEAGTYPGEIKLNGADGVKTIDEMISHNDGNSLNGKTLQFTIPQDAKGHQIHLILQVTDDHPEAPMTAYRRIVIDVKE